MSKSFFFFCCFSLLSQMSSASIIIDIDVKIALVVPPNDLQFNCPPSGCSFNWAEGETYWASISAPLPSVNYMPLRLQMLSFWENDHHLFTREANSQNPLPGICLGIAGNPCGFPGSTTGYLDLLNEANGSPIGKIRFTLDNGIVTFTLDPILTAEGYRLKMAQGLSNPGGGGQAMQSNPSGANAVLPSKAQVADRGYNDSNNGLSVLVSPNPFSQIINVHVSGAAHESVTLQLLNTAGQVLRSQKYARIQEELHLQTDDIPSGVYFLRIQAEGNSVHSQRVVKIE